MTTRCRLVSCLLLVPMALAAQAPPPDAQDQPVFRADITYIEVDVFVTDRDGTFVRDLTKEDFELLEDGAPQEVTAFSFVDVPLPSDASRQAAIDRALDPSASSAGEPDGRVYSMLLDAPLLTASNVSRINDDIRRIQNAATRFLEEAFGEFDRMSVLHVQNAPEPVQQLTSSRPHLRAAIGALGSIPQRDAFQMLGRQLAIRRILNGYRAIEAESERLGAIDGRRKAILWIGGRAPFSPAGENFDAAEASAIAFAQRDAVRAAARNNVAVYPIDPAGLSTNTGARELSRVAGLRDVAADTGGMAIVNTNNLSGGYQRIVRDNSTYYLLGYYPALEFRDGRFHEITVNVKRPGVSVRARRGFFAPESRAPVAAAVVNPAERSPAAAAIDALGRVDFREPLRLHTAVWKPESGEGNGAVWMVGELDAQTRRERSWASGATAEVVLLSAGGEPVVEQTVEVAASDLSFSLRTPENVDLTEGGYTLRVQLRGSGVASSLSEIAQVVVPAEGTPIGEAVLWRRGPSTGRQHVRTADLRFRRNEQLRLELPTSSDAPIAAQLLGRTGDPMQIPLQVSERQDGALRWVVVDVPLAPLAASDYLVEVTQAGTTRLTAFRMVP